jgi:hypothetical protein
MEYGDEGWMMDDGMMDEPKSLLLVADLLSCCCLLMN